MGFELPVNSRDYALRTLQDAQEERSRRGGAKLSIYQTFYSTRSVRIGGEMSAMQEHFV